MYLFKADPNEYGIPDLVSHTISQLAPNNSPKRMGVFSSMAQNYFLVIKSIQRESGSFLIRLVFEYGNVIFIFLFGVSIVSLIYIGKLTINLKKRDRIN